MDKQTYTTSSLARLLGISRHIVYNAKDRTEAKPGSRTHAVLEGMRKHGISWEQVELESHGGRRTVKKIPCEPVPPVHEEAVEQVPAASTDLAPQYSQSTSRHTDSEAITRLLDTTELETELQTREKGSRTPDRIGADITLEDLLLELGRRLPNARLTLDLPIHAEK